MRYAHRSRGLTLTEVLVVLIVLGIVAFTAVPRISGGDEGRADSALAGNLTILRNAIDVYASHHGGNVPSLERFEAQLTQYTDSAGDCSTVMDEAHVYRGGVSVGRGRSVPSRPVRQAT